MGNRSNPSSRMEAVVRQQGSRREAAVPQQGSGMEAVVCIPKVTPTTACRFVSVSLEAFLLCCSKFSFHHCLLVRSFATCPAAGIHFGFHA